MTLIYKNLGLEGNSFRKRRRPKIIRPL